MIVLWIIVIIIGTLLTIWSSQKLSKEWSKNDTLKQSHVIPDFLLLDCDAEIEIEENQRNQILKIVLERTHGQGKMETLVVSPFFDQTNTKYTLPAEIYKDFLNFEISGIAFSNDKTVNIQLSKNNTPIEILGEENKDKSYIRVISYNSKTNTFKMQFRNILLDVNSTSRSQFILDLENAELTLNIASKFRTKQLKNLYLKTKKVKYFFIPELKQDRLGFKGNLKILV